LNRKSYPLIFLTFLIIGLLSISINANAFTFTYYQTTNPAKDTLNLDDSFVTLSSGKVLYVQIEGSGYDQIHFFIINKDGTKFNDYTYTYSDAGTTTTKIGGLSLTYVSDSDILVQFSSWIYYPAPTYDGAVSYLMVYNSVASTYVLYKATALPLNGNTGYSADSTYKPLIISSKMQLHSDGKYYGVVSYASEDSAHTNSYFTLIETIYTVATSLTSYRAYYTYTGSHSANPSYIYKPNILYDSTGYMYIATGTNYINMVFLKLSLTGHTTTVLATDNTQSDFPSTVGSLNTVYCNVSYSYKNLDNGIIINGTNKWLYYSWVFGFNDATFGDKPSVKFVQDRLEFNTSITTATLEAQDPISYSMQEINGYDYVPWVTGYKTYSNQTSYTILCEDGYATYNGEYYVFNALPDKIQITITADWFDNSLPDGGLGEMIGTITGSAGTLPYPSHSTAPFTGIGTNLSGNFMIEANLLNTQIYTNLQAFTVIITTELSYSPAGDVLTSGTPYYFTPRVLINSVGTEGVYFTFEVDGTVYASGTTLSNGYRYLNLPFTFSSAGIHTVDINVYYYITSNGKNPDYIGEYPLTVASNNTINGGGGGGGGSASISEFYSSIYTVFMPMAVFLIAPAVVFGLLFAKMGGTASVIGMMVGLGMGTVIGVQTAYIPPYVLYLYVLILAVVMVFMLRSGSTGGG
jgi:hypothetical protein